MLVEGNGAIRQLAAFARGGFSGLLADLVDETAQPDGVGLGSFQTDGTAKIYRKPVMASRSETFIDGAHKVRSTTFLSHIRHATAAEPRVENTHPFEQHGRLLAHNGVVGDVAELRRRLGSYTELVHVDSQLRVTSTLAVPDPPAHLMKLSELSEREAVSQGLTGTHRIS